MQDNSQENNNFDTIMSGWRRLSREQIESSAPVSASGDLLSPSQPTFRKEEEPSTLVMERPRGPIATAASAGTTVVAIDTTHDKETNTFEADQPDEKEQKFITHDSEDNKEAGGDTYRDEKDDKSFLEDDSVTSKSEKDRKEGDKVDSVYLRPPPPHKARSNASTTNDEEDCGVKCLYYTLQCCDCVIM